MSNLIIDEGNTLCKAAVVSNGAILAQTVGRDIDDAALPELAAQYGISSIISASTRRASVELPAALQGISHTRFDATTKLPIKIKYSTPGTLGLDRVAAAVGASVLFPQSDVLIIDLGTAITIDFLSRDGEFLGGVISPGPAMRAKALNTFTGRLPLVDIPAETRLRGQSTTEALQFGILNGIRFEIDSYIDAYRAENQNIKVVVTGGAANTIVRPDVVREPNLVIIGMNRILEFANAQ